MKKNSPPQYTCKDYQMEMMLIGLTNRLHGGNLSEEEKQTILLQIEELELAIGIR
jgi:hypothetical protein